MRKCPHCASKLLAWDSYAVTTIPPTGGTIPAPKLILGCQECSETVESATLDDVAALLDRLKVTTVAA